MITADIVEVHIDTLRCCSGQLLADIAVLVVERGVVTVLLLQQRDLLRRPGRTDHPSGAEEFRDLPGCGADRAGSAGDEHRLTRLQTGDAGQPDIGGEPGHPQDVQPQGQRHPGDIGDDPEGLGGILHGVGPAVLVQDDRTHRDVLGGRFDDPADGAAGDRLPDAVGAT